MKGLKLKENEVVHCKTEKQANKVLEIAYKLGCDWNLKNGDNRFKEYTKETVYHLDHVIRYSNLDYCKIYEKQVITAKEFLKRHKEPKKGKLTIIVSKNYKELYEDNLALLNHILLDTVKNDKQWVEKVQKSNLNITLYTDKNDTELFKKSFGKFEVKLMDEEECNNNLKGLVLVAHKGVDKSRLQDTKYVEQMRKEGKILHVENFNKSLAIDNGSTISNVKEGEAKSIEELHAEHKEQFVERLKRKLNFKVIDVSYLDFSDQIPSQILDSLKFRTPQGQEMLKIDSNQVNTNHNLKPRQYQIGIDTFERAKANLTTKEYLACLKFGIDKYTWREKDQDIEDFEKIIAYAKEAINVLKSKKQYYERVNK